MSVFYMYLAICLVVATISLPVMWRGARRAAKSRDELARSARDALGETSVSDAASEVAAGAVESMSPWQRTIFTATVAGIAWPLTVVFALQEVWQLLRRTR